MPVLVTGAHRPLARQIAARLLEEGGEVRAHASGDTGALRAAGAIIAPGAGDDEGHLEASLAQVHTAVHVGAGLLASDPDVLVTEAAVLARAATNAGVRRLILLSVAGSEPGSLDPLRAAQAEVEALVGDGAVPSIVLRMSLVDTPRVRDALTTAGLSAEERDVEVAPIRSQDVAELVTAFDGMRSTATTGHATFCAAGPVTMTVADYLSRVGVASPGAGGLVGRKAFDPGVSPLLLPALRSGPWTQMDAPFPDAWEFAQITPGVVGPA
jgi:uncharacterized protein YbjT (DUF2867 family)